MVSPYSLPCLVSSWLKWASVNTLNWQRVLVQQRYKSIFWLIHPQLMAALFILILWSAHSLTLIHIQAHTPGPFECFREQWKSRVMFLEVNLTFQQLPHWIRMKNENWKQNINHTRNHTGRVFDWKHNIIFANNAIFLSWLWSSPDYNVNSNYRIFTSSQYNDMVIMKISTCYEQLWVSQYWVNHSNQNQENPI